MFRRTERSPTPTRRRRRLALATCLVAALAMAPAMSAEGVQRAAQPPTTTPEKASLVTLRVPDQAAFDRLVGSGADLTGRVRRASGGIEVDAVVTPSRLDGLKSLGATVAPDRAAPPSQGSPGAAADKIVIERAVWFRTKHGYFISVEATSSAAAETGLALTASWRGSGGTSGQEPLEAYVDAGAYLGHQMQNPAAATGRPFWVSVTSNRGGKASAPVTEWPGGRRPPPASHRYKKDFVDSYMAPAALYDRIRSLHRRYPRLTGLIDLPYKTNGYRRNAQAVLGAEPASSVVVTSRAYGSEGGNDLLVELADPGAPNRPLGVTVDGKRIAVSLATGGDGASTSTAAQVVAALNAGAGSLVTASTYRGDAGGGVAKPATATQLSDFLKAPASVSRKPLQVQALRIGVHRDGSRTGVLAYAQEHAREWVTPLVTVETAERLLRNYDTDPWTRALLRDTEIFIMPSVNPDGANYSFYDFNMQRKNMRNHCPAAQADPASRNTWGVDVNRNYAVGSLFDGYFGASANCQSGTFAGPAEHSEPESRNVIWMAQRFGNIKFAMNVHSYGGYFMWPPGAYKLQGRQTLPRPTAAQEAFFMRSAKSIEEAIAAERRTVTWPQQTGPVTDVLYSAAGNSADELWYDHGIFGWDFEVGNDVWDPAAGEWADSGAFQPAWPEGHAQALEYSSGLIGLIRVAADYRDDR